MPAGRSGRQSGVGSPSLRRDQGLLRYFLDNPHGYIVGWSMADHMRAELVTR